MWQTKYASAVPKNLLFLIDLLTYPYQKSFQKNSVLKIFMILFEQNCPDGFNIKFGLSEKHTKFEKIKFGLSEKEKHTKLGGIFVPRI